MAQRSLDLIEAMRGIAKAAQPITGRGVGYKLFTRGLIPSMSTGEWGRSIACCGSPENSASSHGDGSLTETRAVERVTTWDDPADTPSVADPIVATSGTSNHIGSRSGPRKAPCAVCLSRCSITTPLASFRCDGFTSGTERTTLPRMTMAAR